MKVRDIAAKSDKTLFELDLNGYLADAVFSAEGTRLAIAVTTWEGCGPGETNVIHLWDVSGPSSSFSEIASLGTAHVFDLAFSSETTLLAAATNSGILIMDAQNGTQIVNLNPGRFVAFQVMFAPDGRTLLSKGADGVIRIWGVPSDR